MYPTTWAGQISSRPHTTDFPQKVAFWKGNSLISGKSRLVKYYNLARIEQLFVHSGAPPLFWEIFHVGTSEKENSVRGEVYTQANLQGSAGKIEPNVSPSNHEKDILGKQINTRPPYRYTPYRDNLSSFWWWFFKDSILSSFWWWFFKDILSSFCWWKWSNWQKWFFKMVFQTTNLTSLSFFDFVFLQ